MFTERNGGFDFCFFTELAISLMTVKTVLASGRCEHVKTRVIASAAVHKLFCTLVPLWDL